MRGGVQLPQELSRLKERADLVAAGELLGDLSLKLDEARHGRRADLLRRAR